MESYRCFVALPLPSELKERVAEFQQRLSSRLSTNALKWTKRDQWHLTLVFLGNVDVDRIDAVKASLSSACAPHASMNLRLETAGCFPNFKRPNVIWIGVGGDVGPLGALANSTRGALEPFCERPEKKPFNAHLTLARTREAPMRELARIGASIQSLKMEPLGAWRADHVELIRSELLPEGPRYTLLQTVPLPSR